MKYTYIVVIVLLLMVGWPLRMHAVAHAPTSHVLLAESEREESEEDAFEPEDDIQPTVVQSTPALNTATAPTTTINSPSSATSETTPASVETAVAQPVVSSISTTFPWSWVVTRVAGIASFVLLALTTIIGIAITTGLMFRFFSPAAAWSIHRAIGTVMLVSIVLHVGSLLFDSFLGLRISDILIPFVSFYRKTLVSLGIIGFYLMLGIVGTSLYTMTSHAKFWRFLHYFGFVMFILIFLHGVLIGTDTREWWMKVMYWTSAFAVTGFGIYRIVWKLRKPAI